MNVGKDRQFDIFQINAYISFGRIFLLSGFADMVAYNHSLTQTSMF
jgi:hypothetical protein